MQSNKMTEVHFKKIISAGAKDKMSYRVPSDCTIESMTVNFYAGQERSLRLVPIAKHGRRSESIVEMVGEDFLSGDDDVFEYDVSIPMSYDDEIIIHYENTASYAYTLDVKVQLDYKGGQERAGK